MYYAFFLVQKVIWSFDREQWLTSYVFPYSINPTAGHVKRPIEMTTLPETKHVRGTGTTTGTLVMVVVLSSENAMALTDFEWPCTIVIRFQTTYRQKRRRAGQAHLRIAIHTAQPSTSRLKHSSVR